MKHRYTAFVPRFASSLVLGLLSFPAISHAQDLPVPAPTKSPLPTATVTPETAQQMADRVLKETSTIRHLSIKSQVKTDVKTNDQIGKFMAAQIKRNASSNEILATNLYFRQFGLAPKTYNILTSYSRVLGEQIAGYYDNKTKQFTTSSHVNPLELETVMAHELTHALQDQHFNLKAFKKGASHNSDASLARKSLIEGDATLVMSRYASSSLLRSFGSFAAELSRLMSEPETREVDNAPKSLRASMGFPYTSGLKFATNLYNRGGWSAISKAYNRPPISTQQVLHFDKYLANKKPENVPVPDVLRVLGKGWKLLDHDVDGEFGLSLLLSEYVDLETSRSIAAGWAGDRYAIYSGPKGAALIVQDTRWEDEEAAEYWGVGYKFRTLDRFDSRAKERQEGDVTIWNAAPDAVWLQQSGRRVIVLEGTVGAFDAKRVFNALRR